MAGEPTAALRFTGVQRAASVGAPPAIPATVYSFVHRAILWVDGGWIKKSSFFWKKRIFLHVQPYNLYVRKKLGGKNC